MQDFTSFPFHSTDICPLSIMLPVCFCAVYLFSTRDAIGKDDTQSKHAKLDDKASDPKLLSNSPVENTHNARFTSNKPTSQYISVYLPIASESRISQYLISLSHSEILVLPSPTSTPTTLIMPLSSTEIALQPRFPHQQVRQTPEQKGDRGKDQALPASLYV